MHRPLPNVEEYLPPWSGNPLRTLLHTLDQPRIIMRHRFRFQSSFRQRVLNRPTWLAVIHLTAFPGRALPPRTQSNMQNLDIPFSGTRFPPTPSPLARPVVSIADARPRSSRRLLAEDAVGRGRRASVLRLSGVVGRVLRCLAYC